MKVKLVKPEQCSTASSKAPDVVIDFVPMRKRNVGIGYVTEGEANAKDFKKYPVVERPWIKPEAFEPKGR